MEPQSYQFKQYLKSWVLSNIPKDGDYILQGKIKPPEKNDWLYLELQAWQEREKHNVQSLYEVENIEEEIGIT